MACTWNIACYDYTRRVFVYCPHSLSLSVCVCVWVEYLCRSRMPIVAINTRSWRKICSRPSPNVVPSTRLSFFTAYSLSPYTPTPLSLHPIPCQFIGHIKNLMSKHLTWPQKIMTAFRFHLATTEIAFYLWLFTINTIFNNNLSWE